VSAEQPPVLSRSLLPLVAAAWIAGLLCAPARAGAAPALAALAVSVGMLYVGRAARARSWGVALLAAAFAAGWVAGPRPLGAPVPSGLARIEGRVIEVRYGTSPRAYLAVERAARVEDDRRWPDGARVMVWDLDEPPGTRVRLLGAARPRTEFINPTPHPRWRSAHSVHGTVRLRAAPRVLSGPLTPALHRARGALRRRLDATLPPSTAGVARALLLGDADAVPRWDRAAVQGAGLAHLLAVSGLHVAIFAGFVAAAVRRLAVGRVRDPGRAAALGVVPASLGFALLAGGAPSAWRAATMASLGALALALRRRPDPLGLASLAAIAFALVAPEDAASPGFLLSILATAAIVTIRRDPEAPANPLSTAWGVSTRATIATAPLVLWCFGGLPLLGVLANVILVPVAVTLLVPLVFLHALAAGVGLAPWTAPALVTVVDAVVGAADAIAVLGWGMNLPPPSQAQGLALCAGAFGLLAAKRWRHAAVVTAGLLAALVACELHLRHVEQPRGLLRITQLDVSQGDSALVDLPDGSAMLVDAGGGQPDPGEGALLPLLMARRRDHLRLVVLSHPHPDHYQGLRALLDHVRIDEVWDTGQATAETPHGPAARLLRAMRRRGARVRRPHEICGERRVGGVRVTVLWPCPRFDPGLGPNDNSLVIRLRHEARSILFTGDVEALAERALVDSPSDLRADVLKVPHHGSRTSSSAPFLQRVGPVIAVASQGRRNRYGHPHASVVARYAARGVPLLRTDRDGGVVIETNGQWLRWRTAR